MTVEHPANELRLDHPIVDGDGHIVESLPIVVDYIRRVAGDDVADRFVGSSPAFASRRAPLLTEHRYQPVPGNPITPWWALPANALDRATGLLPAAALRTPRRDRHRLHGLVLERRAGVSRKRRRRDPARLVPRAEHLPRRDARRLRRPHDRRGGDPDAHSRRSHRRTRPRGQRTRLQGGDAQQFRRPSPARARSGCALARRARPRQHLRLRPCVGTLCRARRRRDRAFAVAGLGAARVVVALHVQPHRQLRREQRRVREGGLLRRGRASLPHIALRVSRMRRVVGRAAVVRSHRSLAQARRYQHRAPRPRPARSRRMGPACCRNTAATRFADPAVRRGHARPERQPTRRASTTSATAA